MITNKIFFNRLSKKIILVSILVITSLMSIGLSAQVYAVDSKSAVCEGAGIVDPTASCAPGGSSNVASSLIKNGLNLFSAIIGIIAVVMMMLGGVKYIMSQGDAGQVATAKNTILYAAIGLVIVALAQIIVKFVLNRFITP